ncbi:MAG TPA: SurA N-terminal domain-containing protein [Candidatus Omnitrophota bacterium]|nr:SurA N-terminal domain-containing protein [Candidatus Omnitrophota bacterium]HPN88076.1 SurA N-terminal domain-containing protein [Candidatus Omnitrophota bacterium]
MLKILRKKGVAKKILWAVTIIIIFAFGFGGTAYMVARQQQKIKYAGKIFGKTISFEDYEKAYQETVIQSMLHYGDDFSKIREHLDLDTETWDRLILLFEANRQKIQVTDKEIVDILEQYPIFQRNGKFDNGLYNNILRYVFNIRPRPFEEHIRNSIKLQKLFFNQTNSILLSEAKIFEEYKQRNEKIQVNYILITSEQLKNNIIVEEKEVRAYYEEQKNAFLFPASTNFEYLEIPFPSKQQNETDKTENTFDPIKDDLRHKAEAIYDQLQTNISFSQIAKEHQLEVKTTDFFSIEKPKLTLGWPYQALIDIFQMDDKTIYGPFETPIGLYIVKIKEKKEAYIPEYETVKNEVKNALIEKKAQALSLEKANETLSFLKTSYQEPKNFEETAKKFNLEFYQTPLFKRGEYLTNLGISRTFEDAAFALTDKNPISDLIKTGKGFCILQFEKYEAVDEKAFEKEKDAFSENLLTEMRNQAFGEFLTGLRFKAKLEDNISPLKREQKKRR